MNPTLRVRSELPGGPKVLLMTPSDWTVSAGVFQRDSSCRHYIRRVWDAIENPT